MVEQYKGWSRVTCDKCSGHGQVAKYSAFGVDFEGPEECAYCGGSGLLWMSPAGRLAKYPGGRFMGRAA